MTFYNLCKSASLPVEMKVYNLFRRLIPKKGLARYKRNRQRQAIIPDLRTPSQLSDSKSQFSRMQGDQCVPDVL